jgi:hypothetical protein
MLQDKIMELLDYFFEDNIIEKYSLPYIHFPQDSMSGKKMLAWHINNLPEDDLLLSPSTAFSYSSILAGLSEKHIEYFAKKAPRDYRAELFSSFSQEYKIKEVFEIAKAMDADLKNNSTKNQERIKNVIQYINDNRVVFEF